MFDLIPFGRRELRQYDPFSIFDDRFFQQFDTTGQRCKTDVLDKGDHYLLETELPGFTREDIHIDVNGDQLTVCAQHREEMTDEQKIYVRRERRSGSYIRSFLVSDVIIDQITAIYENGLLSVQLPKLPSQVPPSRKIEIQ